MTGLCECGCGATTPPARQTDASRGWVRDRPVRFRPGHSARTGRGIARPINGVLHLSCSQCKASKPVAEFYGNATRLCGRTVWCISCTKEAAVAQRLKTKYGITLDEYDEMLATQGGGCAICSAPAETHKGRMHVDHDHVTGKVRGVLCQRCNRTLGLMGDDADRLDTAARYLRSAK